MYEAEKRVRRFERTYGQRVLRPLLPSLWKALPDPQAGGVWLDWEAGPGILSLDLLPRLSKDATLLVSEQDRSSLRVLHGHHELENDPRLFVRQDNPDTLGLADDVVDVAVGHWRWQYTADLRAGLRELKRVVRPGGKIVLSFLQPGGGDAIGAAFYAAGAPDIGNAIRDDGLPSSKIREALRNADVQQMEVRSFPLAIPIGASTPPMMDPLLLDFLLPHWMGKASGTEITSLTGAPPIDLGADAIQWELKAGIIVATVALPVREDPTRRSDDEGDDAETQRMPVGRKYE